MTTRQYSVLFVLAARGAWQNDTLEIDPQSALAKALFKRFAARLTKKFPGELSEDGKRFTTSAQIPFVKWSETQPPTFRFEVTDLLPSSSKPESFYQQLKEVSFGPEYFNRGIIILTDNLVPPKFVSPTAVDVVARNVEVEVPATQNLGRGVVQTTRKTLGLPEDVANLVKKYGGKTRRKRRMTRRRK